MRAAYDDRQRRGECRTFGRSIPDIGVQRPSPHAHPREPAYILDVRQDVLPATSTHEFDAHCRVIGLHGVLQKTEAAASKLVGTVGTGKLILGAARNIDLQAIGAIDDHIRQVIHGVDEFIGQASTFDCCVIGCCREQTDADDYRCEGAQQHLSAGRGGLGAGSSWQSWME